MADENAFTYENDLYRAHPGFAFDTAGLINDVIDFHALGRYQQHLHMNGQTTSGMAHFPMMNFPNPVRFQHRPHPVMARHNLNLVPYSGGPAEAENTNAPGGASSLESRHQTGRVIEPPMVQERVLAREPPSHSVPPVNGKRRASDKAISELKPLRLIDLAEEDDSCIICMEDYVDIVASIDKPKQEHALQMPCGHIFGSYCLKLWLKEHYSCPTCRKEVDSVALEDKERREERRTRFPYRRHRRTTPSRDPEAVVRQTPQGWSRTPSEMLAEHQQRDVASRPQAERHLVHSNPSNLFSEGPPGPGSLTGWRTGAIQNTEPQIHPIGHVRADESTILDESGNVRISLRRISPSYQPNVEEARRGQLANQPQPQDIANGGAENISCPVDMNSSSIDPLLQSQLMPQRAQQRRSWRQLRISHHRPYPNVGGMGRIAISPGSPTGSPAASEQAVIHGRERSSNIGPIIDSTGSFSHGSDTRVLFDYPLMDGPNMQSAWSDRSLSEGSGFPLGMVLTPRAGFGEVPAMIGLQGAQPPGIPYCAMNRLGLCTTSPSISAPWDSTVVRLTLSCGHNIPIHQHCLTTSLKPPMVQMWCDECQGFGSYFLG